MNKVIHHKRQVGAKPRKNQGIQGNSYRQRTRNKNRGGTIKEEGGFDIKLYSMQQLIITICLFMTFLIVYFLPIQSTRDYVHRINTYISEDIKMDQVYETFNQYIEHINSTVGFLNKDG